MITESTVCGGMDNRKPEAQVPFAAAAGYAVKPPLGIIPRKLCVEKRLNEITEAIKRYHDGHYIIPVEWFEEAAEIGRWLERHHVELETKHESRQNQNRNSDARVRREAGIPERGWA